MLDSVRRMVESYEEAHPHADPRTKHWLLLHNSPLPVWTLTAAYLIFLYIGAKVMRNRKPFHLQWTLVIYNAGLVALSLYMLIEIILSAWDAGYGIFCSPYNKASQTDPKEMRVARVLWWYFFSKAIELMDTVLMILRKKNAQITFLHVFHHASMLNIWWWVMMFIPGGLSCYGSSFNCLVHVVMYAYYGLSVIPSLREKLWWKKYITKLQLLQFGITFFHTAYSLRLDCDFPPWGQYLLTSYMVIMVILFGNFYFQAYTKQRRLAKSHLQHSNGGAQNGHVMHIEQNDGVSYSNGYVPNVRKQPYRKARKDQ